jgi:two-component system, NtrC family, sensor kinase
MSLNSALETLFRRPWHSLVNAITQREPRDGKAYRSETDDAQSPRAVNFQIELPDQSIHWSIGTTHLFGRDLAQKARTLTEYLRLVHPDDRPRVRRAVDQNIANGKPIDLAYRIVTPNGSTRDVAMSGQPVTDKTGAVIGIFGTILEVSARQAHGHSGPSLADSLRAITLENKRLLEKNDRNLLELTVLNRIQTSINSTLELDWVLQLTMHEVQDLFGVEKCSLLLLDEQTNELFFQVALGRVPNEQIRIDVDQGIAGWVFRTGEPALVNDVHADPRWYSQPDTVTGFTTRSILAHPLKTRDKVIGVIELMNKTQGDFAEQELELLDSISNSIAGAIENARLFGELNKAYQDMARDQDVIVESRNTLRTLFDGIDDSICIVDQNLRVRALNRSAAAQIGIEPRQGVGKYCYEFLDQSDRPCDQCPINETFRTGKPVLVTQSRVWRDGKPRELEVRTFPLENPDGTIERAIEIVRDVTEMRKMEATLIQSAKLSAVGELAAGVAHEINNPLTVVYGNAQMLLRALDASDPRYQMAELIERTGLRASRVVRNLLDFSRQEDYQFAPIDLNVTIEDALALILHQLQQSKIRVTKNLGGNLPLVNASAFHLQTIWTNLLINARDAMGEESGGKIQVATRLSEDGQSVLASFTDNGPGIAERDLAHIFEPFFTTKPRGRGSGLGLYVSFMIVAQHRGTMQVSSQPGDGTTFVVSLPLASE